LEDLLRYHILLVEDDGVQADIIREFLEREGNKVYLAENSLAALQIVRSRRLDAIVLDIGIPVLDGISVCRKLRNEYCRVPVLMLTGKIADDELLAGLNSGADDYVTQAVGPSDLAARIYALIRRTQRFGVGSSTLLGVRDLVIDIERYDVRVAGTSIPLTVKEFSILAALARDPGRVLSRNQIMDRVFGVDQSILQRTVDVHVMNLRRKLRSAAPTRVYIETVYGVGYRLSKVGGVDCEFGLNGSDVVGGGDVEDSLMAGLCGDRRP
jgi:DNA-binding response OmpR family regulator